MQRMHVFVVVALVLVTLAVTSVASQAQDARAPRQAGGNRVTAESEGEGDKSTLVNQWTVGLAGGQLEGTFVRFVVDLAKAFDDGENLRVLPVITYGATENVSDLLYLKGIDIAITHGDVFEEYKKKKNIGNIGQRINYIAPMYVSELSIVARPEITSLKDLEGKTVSLGTKGAGQTVTGPIVFNRLGIKVDFQFMNNSIAYEKMKTGEIAALVHQGGKPNEFLTNMKADTGFHLLSIPYGDNFADYYVPATVTSKDYPNLVKEGDNITTIGNLVVLAVYNWPANTDRHRRVERFIEYFFERFDKLKGPAFHPKWKEINLAGTVPGWTRYPVAERMVARLTAEDRVKQRLGSATQETAATGPRSAGVSATGREAAEEQRLFDEFLEWKKSGGRRN
jgi:TRAP transporter TAXI family solute receptor